MKVEINENNELVLKEIYNGISLETNSKETFNICMRDSGFEFNYMSEWYFAKEGVIERTDGVITTNGCVLITKERKEQIGKHCRSIEEDVEFNSRKELSKAARFLLKPNPTASQIYHYRPIGWNKPIWEKMCAKTYEERLVIAGALIAAEIDRLLRLKEESTTNETVLKNK